MDFINIIKLPNEEDKYELFIDNKRACRGNLAAVVATINVNLPSFTKKYNISNTIDREKQFYTDLIIEENEQK